MLYNIVLVSAIHQHKSATGIHMSPPCRTSSPPPTPSHPLGCHRAPGLSSLHHTAHSHWLSILHMVIYMFQCYPFSSSLPLLPPTPVSTSLSSMSASPLLPCRNVHHYHLSRPLIYALIYDICFSLSDLLHSV